MPWPPPLGVYEGFVSVFAPPWWRMDVRSALAIEQVWYRIGRECCKLRFYLDQLTDDLEKMESPRKYIVTIKLEAIEKELSNLETDLKYMNIPSEKNNIHAVCKSLGTMQSDLLQCILHYPKL